MRRYVGHHLLARRLLEGSGEAGEVQVSISPTFLLEAFASVDPNNTKRKSYHQCLFFALLESILVKAACKMLVKSTPGFTTRNGLKSSRGNELHR